MNLKELQQPGTLNLSNGMGRWRAGPGLATAGIWVGVSVCVLSAVVVYLISAAAAIGSPQVERSSLKAGLIAGARADLASTGGYTVHLPILTKHYDPVLPPFAIQMYGSVSDAYGFGHIVQSGARWVRIPVYWSSIEPQNTTPEDYRWAVLDNSVQTATGSDVHLILTIEENPVWARSDRANPNGPVKNPLYLQEFVGALVARYPEVQYWEFYNEPDSWARFGGKGKAYSDMLRSVYPVVKSANPDARVVMGGLAIDYEQWFDLNFLVDVLSNCRGAPCFDVANFHYYPPFRWKWENYGRDIIGKANYMRQVLSAYGFNRPVICTESSWGTNPQWGSSVLQMRYVPKLYARSYAAGLITTSWFAIVDADTSYSGLLDSTFTTRMAYSAYRTLTTALYGARFVRAVPASETGSARVEGYQFSVPGAGGTKRLDVYWYDCPTLVNPGGLPQECGTVAPLAINASWVAKTDTLGARVILHDWDDGKADGRVSLSVDSNPIYIDYSP